MDLEELKKEMFEKVEIDTTEKNGYKKEKQDGISVYDIKGFSENPFKKYTEEDLQELTESIKDNGLLSPIVLLKNEDEENYTILSGHNRFTAIKNLGYTTLDNSMYKILKNISYDEARLILVDTNLTQRRNMLPSEKAKAYKIQQEVITKIKSNRIVNFDFFKDKNDLNTSETGQDKKECTGCTLESRRSIYNYLRLNYLIEKILQKVDEKDVSIKIGVEISYLNDDEQLEVFDYFLRNDKTKEKEDKSKKTLTLQLSKRIREKARVMPITREVLEVITKKEDKAKKSENSKKSTIKFEVEEIKSISKKDELSADELKEYILECIKFYEEHSSL